MQRREYLGEAYYLWALKQYEAARVFLKNCGRPMDDHDKFLIAEAKWDSQYFGKLIK